MTDNSPTSALPASIDELQALLAREAYVADRGLATSIYLALRLGRPLLLEGEAGVGKTEVAKVLANGLGAELIRLQCYEGLDVTHAVYEWNYARQLLEIRLREAAGPVDRAAVARDLFGPDFLIKRPCCARSSPMAHGRQCCSSTSSTAPTRSSRGTCSSSCPTSR